MRGIFLSAGKEARFVLHVWGGRVGGRADFAGFDLIRPPAGGTFPSQGKAFGTSGRLCIPHSFLHPPREFFTICRYWILHAGRYNKHAITNHTHNAHRKDDPALKRTMWLSAAALAMLLLVPALLVSRTFAAETAATVQLPVSEVAVDESTGNFRFDIQVDCPESYAGMEFGVICSEGTEITAVQVGDNVSSTGPKEANGLVWFGYFDGEDSFSGTSTVTVEGKCEPGVEAAIAIRDVKQYTVGSEEFSATQIPSDLVVTLDTGAQQTVAVPETLPQTNDIDAVWLLAAFAAAAAVAVGALIYNKRKQA